MAKSITDIKQELGITSSSTIDYLFTLASQYKVFSQAEINNIKAISVLPLANSVRDKADELKQRFTDIVLNENKGQIHGINVRIVIILELLEKLNTLAETLSEDKADKATTYIKSEVYNKTEADALLNGKADKTDTYTKSEVYNKTETDNLLYLKADKSTTYTKTEANALLDTKADKSTTYTKTETNTLLNGKADKSDTYTRTVIDAMVATLVLDKANKNETYTKTEIDTTTNEIYGMLNLVDGAIDKLESVQNVVDVLATKSALNSYDTTKLEENDKIQVIADETHDGASTIYNWSGSAWQYVGAYGTNSYTKDETLEQINIHKLVNKTYSELATLKNGNNLVPGQLYRITDYVTKTNGLCNGLSNDARSMEHPFDIVLRAISSNKFSENARALLHSGDTYFSNSNLNSWQLWYCFDNDDVRFEWADTLTGKGVIYRMIDEFGNDLPYDFKNIQFKRYKITATTDARHSNAIGKYLGFSGNYNCTSDSTDYVWYFTFSKRADGTDLSLTETLANSYTNCYYVKEVKIGEYLSDTLNYRGIQALNNIVFECDNIVVDVQMGVCSNHNTFIGNKDITYVYFKEMCRNNIVYGEMSHARADECFEQNIMGDFVALSQYTLCWNKFSHHFARNIAVQMQSNDFEAQVSDCKFPENFTRNHIFNMWGSVDASTHDTFNRCELGLFSYTTLSGGGTWDGVYGISLDHCTIKIANLFGSKLGRMEYVTISEGVNNFNVLNLTVGALYGSSSVRLNIALTDLYSYNLTTAYEKKLDYALEPINNIRVLVYSVKVKGTYIVQDKCVVGTINGSTGNVTWALADTTEERIQSVYDGLNNIKMNKLNPTGSGAISMNNGNASGNNSYANGVGTTASGNYSMAVQGNASGSGAIAIGNMANASGNNSKALGEGAKAKGDNQTVIGKFNISDNTSLEIVGCGGYYTEDNARLLDANGNEYLKGDLFIDTTFTKDANKDLVSKNGTSLKQALLNINENLYNESIENGNANTITLSNPQDCGEMVKLGGMSYKSENLLNIENGTYQASGLSLVKNNDGFSLSGTPSNTGWISFTTITLPAGTYFLKAFGTFNSNSNFGLINSSYQSVTWINSTTPFTLGTAQTLSLAITGTNYNNYGGFTDVQIMLVSGSTAPTTYEPYFEGIRNSAVTQITLKDSNNETKSTISIPSAIQNLTGYGWGINDTCYNYIDFDRKVFVQKVGKLVINGTEDGWNNFTQGAITWQYNTLRNLVGSNFKKPNSDSTIAKIVSNYNVFSRNAFTGTISLPAVAISADNNGSINVQVGASNVTDLKTYLGTNNLVIYYELATPIETDISVYYVNDMLSTSLANNDVVEFVNTYNQKVPFSIKYYNKYQLRDISTLVDKDGNPRFIEGNGVGLSQTGVTITQCKWSLSGTHLMLVLAGTIANGTTIPNLTILARYDLPIWIMNKIETVANAIIEYKNINLYASDYTSQSANSFFRKSTDLAIALNGALTLTADRNFKIQFDLLIDSE